VWTGSIQPAGEVSFIGVRVDLAAFQEILELFSLLRGNLPELEPASPGLETTEGWRIFHPVIVSDPAWDVRQVKPLGLAKDVNLYKPGSLTGIKGSVLEPKAVVAHLDEMPNNVKEGSKSDEDRLLYRVTVDTPAVFLLFKRCRLRHLSVSEPGCRFLSCGIEP
jgi:hypothetical protein